MSECSTAPCLRLSRTTAAVSEGPASTVSGQDSGSADAAIASARAALSLDVNEPSRSWAVGRMHPGAPGFVLVVFGTAERASAIAAVDSISGEVLEAARLSGREGHTPITAEEAILRAGFGPGTEARLVWDPSPATRSRFYPLWQLQSGERTAWVDSVRGVVWHTLDAARGGGSVGV